jgi:hypothetical protein
MANALYNNYKNQLLGGGSHGMVNLSSDTISVYLIDTANYTVNLGSNNNASQIGASAKVATATLGSKTVGTVAPGVFDAADTTFTAVSGDQSEALVIWKDSGSQATSPLLVYFDTFASGMPVTPNGGDITIVWNASGIFGF